ncbi:hypothetical protein C8R44DRAFT_983023 [Mycena epipterygia]|nr:hypothetical protein C8R44DRAFT_983023 [Mycena epipterygia]
MAQKLPRELVDLVLGELRTDYYLERLTLARCGLVCKNWLPSSRYHLFAEVTLNDRTMRSFLRVLQTSPLPIPTFIRSLYLSFTGSSSVQSLGEIGPLPQVTHLRITMKDPVYTRNYALLTNSFANIYSLELERCHLQLESVLETVSSFPLLESLGLHRVTLSFDPLASAGYQFPPRWRTLTLDLPKDMMELFFQQILGLDTIPDFTSLSVYRMYPTEESSFGKYLSHVGNGLQYLLVQSDAQTHPDPTALCYSTGLRHLDVVFRTDLNIPSTVFRILRCIRSNSLATVNLIDNGANGIVLHEWEQLDWALADDQFANLHTVTIKSISSMLPQLPQHMPLSVGRGILRVVDVS